MTLTFSNSPLWFNCEAAVSPNGAPLPSEYERDKSEPQLEGEAAAWLANIVLRGDAGTPQEAAGEFAPNGWPIDAEMIMHVGTYCEIVRRHGPVVSEENVSIFNGLVRGRDDAHTVQGGDVLRIYELKYGYKIVEPQGNTQLLCAAIAHARPDIHRLVSLEVFQPRPFHPSGQHRKWVLDLDELHEWQQQLYSRAQRTQGNKPQQEPGAQCDHCPRNGACHGLTLNVYARYEMLRTNRFAKGMTAAELGAEAVFLEEAEKLLKARKSGIESELAGRMKTGEHVPGWQMEQEFGNAVFTVEPSMARLLTGVDMTESKMITPAEAIRRGAHPDVVARISHRPPRKFVPKRFDAKKLARVFK